MSINVLKRMCTFCAASLAIGAGIAHGECVRSQPATPNETPAMDGPGSFGPLQDTVTLDCLTFIRSIQKGDTEYAVVADERGATYEVKVGSYMGENTGLILKMDRDFIYLRQMVPKGDGWEERMINFPKNTERRR
jgi:Pilus assembly protein, PilP